MAVRPDQPIKIVRVYNILYLFDWLISSVGTWLSVLINQSKLYLSVDNILCYFDWLISSVRVH